MELADIMSFLAMAATENLNSLVVVLALYVIKKEKYWTTGKPLSPAILHRFSEIFGGKR